MSKLLRVCAHVANIKQIIPEPYYLLRNIRGHLIREGNITQVLGL